MVVRWLLLLLVPVSILMVPVPSGLTPLAWKIFAVYIAAILGLILRPAGEAVVMLSVIAFGSFIVPVGQLLSGYGNGTVWLVFTAFLITQAFADTGLGRRVAYWMIGRFGKSSLGLVYGQMLTDLILSPATPSNTARSGGIVYPIFRNVASTLNSEPEDNPRRIGSYITISGYAISLSTSAVFLTACAPNILTVGFARDILKVDISWMDWFIGLAFPALLACLVVPYLIYKVYPPELKEISNHKELAAQGLREIGPMTGKEKLLVIFFCSGNVHHASPHPASSPPGSGIMRPGSLYFLAACCICMASVVVGNTTINFFSLFNLLTLYRLIFLQITAVKKVHA